MLIFRALQVGDLLCAVPALRALRQRLPSAEFTLVGLPWASQLLPRYAGLIDHVLAFPGHPDLPEQVPDLDALEAFLCAVRARNADLAIQMHGSGEVSNRIVERFHARQTIGFSSAAQRRVGFVDWPAEGHEIRRCLALPKEIGAPVDDESLYFPILPDDEDELAGTGLLTLLQAAPSLPYVCIHPGARSVDRRWPVAGFSRVADALADGGFKIVLTGSGNEWELAEQVRQQMRSPALNAALPYALGALAVLLRGAGLLVCNDTGMSHLAVALRLPSVVVFSGSDPERWAPLDTRLHRRVVDRDGRRAAQVLAEAERLLALQ